MSSKHISDLSKAGVPTAAGGNLWPAAPADLLPLPREGKAGHPLLLCHGLKLASKVLVGWLHASGVPGLLLLLLPLLLAQPGPGGSGQVDAFCTAAT